PRIRTRPSSSPASAPADDPGCERLVVLLPAGGPPVPPAEHRLREPTMRWLARRLAFYAFALWAALTINFLLPRLMPGDPIAGLLQHISPSQIQANPGIVQTYQTL